MIGKGDHTRDSAVGFCGRIDCPGSCVLGQRACLVRSRVPNPRVPDEEHDGDGAAGADRADRADRAAGLGTPIVLWPAGSQPVWGAFNGKITT